MQSKNFLLTLQDDLLRHILLFLDCKSLLNFLQTSKATSLIADKTLWKLLALRDYEYYLINVPLTEEQLKPPRYRSHVTVDVESEEDAQKNGQDIKLDPLTIEEQQNYEKNLNSIEDWHNFYVKCAKKIKLQGAWEGDYEAHGLEKLKIYQSGYKLRAVKVTGDLNVPAKKVTWEIRLNADMTKGKGRIHLADIGFKNSRWATAYVGVNSERQLVISWFFPVQDGMFFKLSYGNHREGEMPFMSRKMDPIYLEDDV